MNQDQTIDDLLAKYLADETDAHESDTISEWIIASEDNQKTFDHSKLIWDGVKGVQHQQKVDVDAAWKKLNITKKEKIEVVDLSERRPLKKLNWVTNFLKIAAVFVLLFGLWYVAAKQFATPKNDVLTFQSGNQSVERVLPDGTKIILSKNSTVTYPVKFEGENREVNLIGEGFFDVHHDNAHPFIIHTQGTDVKVLGTSFNVRAYNAQVQVVVKTGRVQFSKNNSHVILEKGQKAEVLANVNTIVKSEDLDRNTDVQANAKSFIFEKKSLAEVTEILSQKYDIQIIISQDKIKNCKLTASFEHENLENIITVIAETFNLKIQYQDDRIILSGEGCE
ncbi:FecR domain-containing protein [Arcicella sp. LKC2W]|uniref:FecR family protein n=1 Tax=Arcicella sp. LKC2W TaxID=2984198 RepID=UPI002B1F815E|nr:FecR domain-containing protein [Arcicella sp. LKC2W]MEA5459287.1 FecR domain-containing protein [Arcicella sp. LKC2W]